MPDDFANEPYDCTYERVADVLGNQQPQPPIWPEYSSAWLGITNRFRSCAEYDKPFTESVGKFGDTPDWPERYKQERDLFGFFVNGLSAIECACYGLFAVSAWLNPSGFAFRTDAEKSRASPESTLKRFEISFPNDGLTRTLRQIQSHLATALGHR
jgi:hypothetical protein